MRLARHKRWIVIALGMIIVPLLLWYNRNSHDLRAGKVQLTADSLLEVQRSLQRELTGKASLLKELNNTKQVLSQKLGLLKYAQGPAADSSSYNHEIEKDLDIVVESIDSYRSDIESLEVASEKLEEQIEEIITQLD